MVLFIMDIKTFVVTLNYNLAALLSDIINLQNILVFILWVIVNLEM